MACKSTNFLGNHVPVVTIRPQTTQNAGNGEKNRMESSETRGKREKPKIFHKMRFLGSIFMACKSVIFGKS
jgi:hypothetical protein